MTAEPTEDSSPYYTASLRVFSATLAVEDIVAALGEPTTSHRRGDPVSPRRDPDGRKRDQSGWLLQSSGYKTGQPLEDQIEELAVFAEHHVDAIDRLRSDCDADLYCGAFAADTINCGVTLTPALMARLAALDLPVYIDIYQ
jgi:hypothetical protein